MVKKINAEQFENEAKKSAVAVVDFSATWCGPCRMLAPVVESVSEKLAGKVDFYNVDDDRIYVTGLSMGGFGTWDLLNIADGNGAFHHQPGGELRHWFYGSLSIDNSGLVFEQPPNVMICQRRDNNGDQST